MNKNAFCCKLLNIKHFRQPAPPKSLISKYLQKKPRPNQIGRGQTKQTKKLKIFFLENIISQGAADAPT